MSEKREAILVHCGHCEHEWSIGFAPMPVDTFVKVGKSSCPSCRKRDKVFMGPLPRTSETAEEWVGNGDTGTSSLTIWAILMGRRSPHGRFGIPYDPSDFGRCYRLLKLMPQWRLRLNEVAQRVPQWVPFVKAWDELTALYEDELANGPVTKGVRMAPRTYERMRQLRDEAEAVITPAPSLGSPK